jgi:hypothetical protein
MPSISPGNEYPPPAHKPQHEPEYKPYLKIVNMLVHSNNRA